MSGVSLEACLTNVVGSPRLDIAVYVATEVANMLSRLHEKRDPTGRAFFHGSLSPRTILIHHDGVVEVNAPSGASRTEALRSSPDYLAPEQIQGADVDPLADVFSLGIVTWEFMTTARLFERATATAARLAVTSEPILSVSDVNPEVSHTLAEVVARALTRERGARFQTVLAFRDALHAAATATGLGTASQSDLAKWAHENHPASSGGLLAAHAVPELGVPGMSRAHRSLPRMQAVVPPSAGSKPHAPPPPTNPRPSPSTPHLPAQTAQNAPSAAPASAHTRAAGAAPPSGSSSHLRAAAPPGSPSSSHLRAAPPPPSHHGGGREVTFDSDDDDDFEIERNATNTTAFTSSAPGPNSRSAGAGLELAQPSRITRERAAGARRTSDDAGFGAQALGFLVAGVVASGTAFGLWHQVHRAGGRDITRLVPHAFDGSNAVESAAVTLGSLAVAVVLGFIGLRLRPHAWSIVASGGVFLLQALAMVTVTLASTGDNGAPPDGGLLVPYLLPAAIALFASGLVSRAARVFAEGYGSGRALVVPLSVIAGILLFAAIEVGRLGH